MPVSTYEDHGVRFEYPSDWEMEVTDDGPVTTVDVAASRRRRFPAGEDRRLVSRPRRSRRLCPGGDARGVSRPGRRSGRGDAQRASRVRVRRRVLLARHFQHGPHPLLPHTPTEQCWFSASGRTSARRTSRISSVACSARSKRRKIEPRLVILAVHHESLLACNREKRQHVARNSGHNSAGMSAQPVAAPLVVSSRNAAIRSRSSSPPMSIDIGVFRAGDVEPAGR